MNDITPTSKLLIILDHKEYIEVMRMCSWVYHSQDVFVQISYTVASLNIYKHILSLWNYFKVWFYNWQESDMHYFTLSRNQDTR